MTNPKDYVVVYITCPSKDEAEELSRKVLAERLSAYTNVVAGVQSFFHTEDAVDSKEESLMILRTKKELVGSLMNFVQMHHSLDVPEVIVLPVIGGSDEYLNWLNAEV